MVCLLLLHKNHINLNSKIEWLYKKNLYSQYIIIQLIKKYNCIKIQPKFFNLRIKDEI